MSTGHRRTLLIAILLSAARIAAAQCVLPPVAQLPTGYLTTPAARYSQALTYADHQCLAEARLLLAEAEAGLASQKGDRAATLRNLVGLARDYVEAIDAIGRGQNTAGYARLRRIIEQGANVVSFRAVIKLGTAIVREADMAQWRVVEEPLQELSRRGHIEADFLLIERNIKSEGIPAAIARIERRLEDRDDIQTNLSLHVLLVDLYARAEQFIDAQLLLATLERDAAATLLDVTMRKRLLTVGLTVSSALVNQGRTEFTNQRDAYALALAEIKRFVP